MWYLGSCVVLDGIIFDLCLLSYYEPESDWPAQNKKGNKLNLAHQIRISEIYPRIENFILSMLFT